MKENLAVVGSGPVGFGIIFKLAEEIRAGKQIDFSKVDIFDIHGREGLGAGLPYDPSSTDPEHLLNVNSSLASDGFAEIKDYPQLRFDHWLSDNQEELKRKMLEIYESRFKEKFLQRFGKEYELGMDLNAEELKLMNHYENIWKSVEKRYLDLGNSMKYHPRIMVGMRNIILFEEAINTLRSSGVEVTIHPKTEVVDLEKIADDQIRLTFEDKSTTTTAQKTFSKAVLSTGRWRVKPELVSPRYLPDIWPIADFKARISEVVKAEIAKRKAENNQDKTINLLMLGNSLTAYDAVKTIFRDSLFEEDKKGQIIFKPTDFDGYQIKVEMVSRSGIMQQVKGKAGWTRQEKFGGIPKGSIKYPQGTEIKQEMIDKIAASQDGFIRLWQVLLMTARAIEIGYRIENETARADQMRQFLKFAITNIKKTKEGEEAFAKDADSFLDSLHGSTLDQLNAIQEKFGLQLDGCHYKPLFDVFKNSLAGDDIAQLRSNIDQAEKGDVKDGYQIWKSIYSQLDDLFLGKYLNIEESAYRFQILDRPMSAFNNGMPPQTAKELLAMHEAGVLEIRTVAANAKPLREENGEIILEENGEVKRYAAAISTRGYD